MLSRIIQDDRIYNFNYDEFLNIKNIKIGDNVTLITNNYEDNNGNLVSSTYGNNHIVNYEYDEYNRIKKLIKMNDTYNYYYGNNGDLLKIKSNDDLIKYTYDSSKRLYKYKFNNFNIKYGYDSNNNVINENYKLNSIEHTIQNTLNDDDAITKVVLDNDEFNYNYDSLGRLASSNINNNFNTNYEYITNGKRTSLLVKSISNNNDKYSYKYDKLNNITHIYHNGNLENRYYYDDYNELIKEDNYLLNRTIRYKYDDLGNLLSKKVYELDTYNQLKQDKYEYNNTNWCDQLTKFNDDIITYDGIGNPLTIGEDITLNWINGRQLNSYTDSNNVITYKYNKDGIRTSKIINNVETKYYLEGSSIIIEKTGDNVLYYLYSNGKIVGFKYNDTSYYYIKNNQNDIIGILDNNYNTVAKYTYDSWGNIISITDGNGNDVSNNTNHIANINPFRYRGYYYDKETNLYYLNSRYYNPIWGRFINADNRLMPMNSILSNNLYSYVENNPINRSDSTGNWFGLDDLIAGVAGAIINTVGQLIADVTTSIIKKKPTFSSWQTYTGAAIGGFIGGVTTLYAGPTIGVAVSVSSSTIIGQTLENITGGTKRTASEIAINTIVDTTFSLAGDKISLKIGGLTAGRNNFGAVYKSGLTKIINGNAGRMSGSVFAKGIVSGTVSGIPGSISTGVKSYVENIDLYNNYNNYDNLGSLNYCPIEW